MTHEISLVNHACLLHEVDGLRLLSDPWLSGSVFAGGWELVHMGGQPLQIFHQMSFG
jgi:L-ascorbate metabolism protein UlaG (beta-lactamase superfamily)